MCTIVDANVASEVFGSNKPPAADKFFQWLMSHGRLIVGGHLTRELARGSQHFREWAAQAQRRGILISVNDQDVRNRTDELLRKRICKSNDPHIIALAQVSGARLLYSNDRELHKDFRDKNLIDDPRGNVYSTIHGGEVRRSHRDLLGNRNLCIIAQ